MSQTDPAEALSRLAELIGDPETLIRVVAGGRRRGAEEPDPAKLTGRVVAIKNRPHLQLVGTTGPRVTTVNLEYGSRTFETGVRAALERSYGSWRVETTEATWQLQITKKGRALLHSGPPVATSTGMQDHDRSRQRLIDPDDPLFGVLGADAAKRRQVDAFLRSLDTTLRRAEQRKVLRPGALRMVDLGCGNAYLTLAAHRYLSTHRPGTQTVGVELRQDLLDRSRERAARAELSGVEFVAGTIAAAQVEGPVDIVLALHACDTATDEALARAIGWRAPVVLAAPCCHHDVQRQLQASGVRPPGTAAVLSAPILRERFADVLTDAVRAAVLRTRGYRADVVEFVESRHTPRNVLLRAVLDDSAASSRAREEVEELLRTWQLRPALLDLLASSPGGNAAETPPKHPQGTMIR